MSPRLSNPMDTDFRLLDRYHRNGDAAAFRELVSAHSRMVFAVARRITQDAALAEEVAQDTFMALARRAESVSTSVSAWLHHVARQKACNALRGELRRQRHEQEAAALPMTGDSREAGWHEIERILDEALQELPGSAQTLLIEHFLEQRGQRDLACRMGISQSTVSRQLESAVQQLRDVLRQKGVVCGMALTGLLSTHPAQASVPDTLTLSLSKLALTGVRSAGPASAFTVTTLFTAMTTTTKILVASAATACVVATLPFIMPDESRPSLPAARMDAPAKVRSTISASPEAAAKPIAMQRGSITPTLDELWEEMMSTPDDQALILAEFKRLGGTIKQEYLETDIDAIIRQGFKGSREAFERSLSSKGLTVDEFREQRRQTMIIAVLKSRATKGAESPEEKQKALESWLAELRRKAAIR